MNKESCELCGIDLGYAYNYKRHLRSKKHILNERNKFRNETSKCIKCDKILTGYNSYRFFKCKECYKIDQRLKQFASSDPKCNIDTENIIN